MKERFRDFTRVQAQLELLYSKFKQKDYEGAIALAERFIRLNPQHPNVDYATTSRSEKSNSSRRIE
ncbi:tetratricopeptide repeat protein [Bacillus sp. D-CC]